MTREVVACAIWPCAGLSSEPRPGRYGKELSLLGRDALAEVTNGRCGGRAFTWWAHRALRTGGEEKIQTYSVLALPDYLIAWNILCLATAQMQTEIREFPAGSCHLLTAHRCLMYSRKSQHTNGLEKNVSYGDICRVWVLSVKWNISRRFVIQWINLDCPG